MYSTALYDYELPEELIAKHPCVPRDSSRLMLVERSSGLIDEIPFHELPAFLDSGDHLVFNDAKVIPGRLVGRRDSGGVTEILLTRRRIDNLWEAIGRPGRKLRRGTVVHFSPEFSCEIVEEREGGQKIVRLLGAEDLDLLLSRHGQLPLPPYIRRAYDPDRDAVDYQTVLARQSGAVAAPTAALHFTDQLIARLRAKGVYWTTVTLDVSLGTFKPVQVDDIRHHLMHTERYRIEQLAAEELHRPMKGKRRVCIGTTCCRLLEDAAPKGFPVGDHETNIFIYPGYTFHYVNCLLTNFHAPASTLLMLVSAFAGYELTKEAHIKAIERRFRFLSYGDAMLIY